MLLLLADTCVRLGEVEGGLKALEEARALVDKSGAYIHEAEWYRLRGELLLAQAKELSHCIVS